METKMAVTLPRLYQQSSGMKREDKFEENYSIGEYKM